MAMITSIAMWNLPFGITEDELETEVVSLWTRPMITARKANTLIIKVFKSKGKQQKAVVKGFYGSLEQMKTDAVGRCIGGRHVCFNSDYGDARDEYGEFTEKRDHHSIRTQSCIEGAWHIKVDMVFSPDFLRQLNPKVFNTLTKTVFVNSSTIPESSNLRGQGARDVKFIYHDRSKNTTVVRFHSALGMMQAIMINNLNLDICRPPLQFMNESGTEFSTITMNRGMHEFGHHYLRVQTCAVEFGGYIPFGSIAPEILDNQLIAYGFASKCWRCEAKNKESTYNLVGISIDLVFIAGICSCSYTSDNLDSSAYHWPEESFTRLVLGETQSDQQEMVSLGIMHTPMNQSYQTLMQYSKIVLSIMEEEWYTVAERFREEFNTVGKIKSALFVEDREIRIKGVDRFRAVFAVEVEINKSTAWCIDNACNIKKATVEMKVEVPGIMGSSPLVEISLVKARIRSILHDTNNRNKIIAQMQIFCEPRSSPIQGEVIKIMAKPDKTEYKTTRRIINTWFKKPIESSQPILEFVLDPFKPSNWSLPPSSSSTMKIQTKKNRAGCDIIRSLLNDQQVRALENALKHGISFVQGPPGTGKTFTASSIVTILACTENGKVYVSTPSNEAADRCAEMIFDTTQKYDLDLKLVRMMARSKEQGYKASPSTGEVRQEQSVPMLHELVQESPDWLKEPEILAIYNDMKNEGLYKLPKKDWDKLEAHIEHIEQDILKTMDIIVCTISTLADGRAGSVKGGHKKVTLVVDEAGQIQQPSTLIYSLLHPKRVIIIGDHLQLQPTIKSCFAKNAGLCKSQLEWAASSRSKDGSGSGLPWTMLVEQHRMAPTIRKLVSAFMYHNKLQDAPRVINRKSSLPETVLLAFPDFRDTPVLIKDVSDSVEVEIGTTFKNPREADEIIKMIGHLVFRQVKTSQITILTLYDGQKKEIQDKMDSSKYKCLKGVAVKNVDAFQGRENDVIILSMVRSNRDVGFLKIPNRINVALSRAKEMLIVVFKNKTFQECKNQSIKSFYKNLTENGKFI